MRIIPDDAPLESCSHTFDSYVQMHHTIEITDDEWELIWLMYYTPEAIAEYGVTVG